MSSLINFESSWQKSEERQEIKGRREHVLKEAKRKYEIEEKRKAEAKARGEDTWMLASVTDRIEQEEMELKLAKVKKKKKKLKKEKKKKKKKKRSSSRSSDDSDSGSAWVEKTPVSSEKAAVIKGPKLERDSWMVSSLDFGSLGGTSRQELKAKKQAEEEEKKRQQTMLDMPGQHERELNPYWKDGGTGAPEIKPSTGGSTATSDAVRVAGDGGVGWLRKALKRCEQQAQEEGRSVEEVAAERYGSLKQLKAQLEEAEATVQAQRRGNRDRKFYPDKERQYSKQREDYRAYNDECRSGFHQTVRGIRKRSIDRESHPKNKSSERDSDRKPYRRSPSESESEGVTSRKRRSRIRDRVKYNKDRNRSRSGNRDKESSRSQSKDRKSYKDRSESRDRSRSWSKDRRKYKARNRSTSSSSDTDTERSRSRSRNRKYKNRSRSRSRSKDRRKYKGRSRSRSRSQDKNRDNRKRLRSGSRDRRFNSGRDSSFMGESRSRGTYDVRQAGTTDDQGSRLKALAGKFKRPGDDVQENIDVGSSRGSRFKKPAGDDEGGTVDVGSSSSGRRFQKPGDDVEERSDTGSSSSRMYTRVQPAWKKKAFVKPGEHSGNEKDSTERSNSSRKVNNEDTSSGKRKQESESSSTSNESESSSDSDREVDGSVKKELTAPKVLSEQEMNQLGAKLVRAEIMGNEALATKIKLQLEQARMAAKTAPKQPASRQPEVRTVDEEENVVVLTRTDKKGNVRPLSDRKHPQEPKRGRKKKQKVETHVGDKGERLRYFQDDDKLGLKDMVEQEKLGTAEDANMMFARLAGRSTEKTTDDYQVDDIFISKASQKEADSKQEDRDRSSAIFEHKKISEAMEKCQFCFDKVPKHLIIAIGIKCYLCLPNHRSLTDGHCFIIPMQHVTQGTAVDEDVWDEMQVFRKGLTKMFEEQDEDCVFMEMSRNLRHHPHMVLECISLPKEVGDLSPIYFKKAIQDCEVEWSQNQKLVDLKGKDVRKVIPKGFPYFSVDFGLQSGFAHVIEDEKEFPPYFGREVVGGMLDVGPELWRKPHKQNFEDQRKKVLKFAEWWKPFDWTQKLKSKEVDT